jgi:hypothetical protein
MSELNDLFNKDINTLFQDVDKLFNKCEANNINKNHSSFQEQSISIRIPSIRHRIKAAWKLLIFGKVVLRKKIKT